MIQSISLFAQLFLLSIFWIATIYIFHCVANQKLLRINIKTLVLYCSVMAMIGPLGEIAINTFCKEVFGSILWRYKVIPLHSASTSEYALVIWMMYGFHLYLLHEFPGIIKKKLRARKAALIIAIDALVLEILLNITAIIFFGTFIFYYIPSDLWHLSTLWVLPFYYLGGLVITHSLRRFKQDKLFFSVMSLLIATTIIYLV